MLELADVFRRHGAAYVERFGARMLPSHRRAIRDIVDCRTEVLGGHLYQCDKCAQKQFAYHSCRNRHCPKCHGHDTEKWLIKRRAELLPVPYFHLVFTLPKELHGAVRAHQHKLYDALCKAAAQALMELAKDPRYVGGQIGLLCVLHTWTKAMAYHPHVHCLVPAGGLGTDGKTWMPARNNFLVPVRALSKLFRGRFIHLAREALPQLAIPESVFKKDWVVFCKPALQGTEKVLKYLGRYVHRIAITNSRLLSMDDGNISFRHKDADCGWKTMTLPSDEFMRRYLQHVLPRGFHKVRFYGLWAVASRKKLQHVREQFLTKPENQQPQSILLPSKSDSSGSTVPRPARVCPFCHAGKLLCITHLARQKRAPP